MKYFHKSFALLNSKLIIFFILFFFVNYNLTIQNHLFVDMEVFILVMLPPLARIPAPNMSTPCWRGGAGGNENLFNFH